MSTEKVEVDPSSAYRLLHPRNTVLVSCADEAGTPNVITLAWAMPTSVLPPMVAISVSPRRYSHGLIQNTREFVINIPTIEMVRETFYCGSKSGRKVDKFLESGLTPVNAKKVKPPIIGECVAHLECKVVGQVSTGDHTIFIGEVLAAYADRGFDPRKIKPIFHAGGDEFLTSTWQVIKPGLDSGKI